MKVLVFLAVFGVLARPAQAQPSAAPITLEELERLALRNNPTATAAAAGIEAARERSRQHGAWPNPVVGYSGEEIKAGDLDVRGEHRERGEDTGRPIGWEGTLEAGISVPLFNRNAGGVAAARADETRAEAEIARLELALQSRAASQFANYLTALRASEAYRSEILPRAEEAYRLYLARYREMAAAYPQVLVAQRTRFEMSDNYLESLNETWHSALQLQGFLAGDGLDAPAAGGDTGETAMMARGNR